MDNANVNPILDGRRARRGDGSALSRFLCPVCFHDALVEDATCAHLLLVQDRQGDVYCRDPGVLALARAAEAECGGRGGDALERLCTRLGPGVVLYELLGAGDAPRPASSVFFVVDTGAPARAAG